MSSDKTFSGCGTLGVLGIGVLFGTEVNIVHRILCLIKQTKQITTLTYTYMYIVHSNIISKSSQNIIFINHELYRCKQFIYF